MKTCSKCKIEKELCEFNKSAKAKDGHKSSCRECQKNDQKNYRLRNPNKDKEYYLKNIEKRKKYKEDNKEYIKQQRADYRDRNREKLREQDRIRIKNNPEKYREKAKRWAEKNMEKVLAYREATKEIKKKKNAIWKKNNKDKVNSYTRARQAKSRKKLPADADIELIKLFYKMAKEITEKTGIEHQVDHIIPLSRGGLHHQDNLRVITAKQNQRKGNKLDSELDFEIKVVWDYSHNI